jgi:hypothetical protein
MVRTIFTVLTHAGVAAATLLFNASAASPGTQPEGIPGMALSL